MDELTAISEALTPVCLDADRLYVRCRPEITDFTAKYDGEVVVSTKAAEVSFRLPDTALAAAAALLEVLVFAPDKVVLAWDIKRLVSYLRFRLKGKYELQVEATVIDLRLVDRFLDRRLGEPQTYPEAVVRARALVETPGLAKLHAGLHVPLATRAVPRIETAGVLNARKQKRVYSSYEIEGQRFGRMKCRRAYPDGLLAHNLSAADRADLIAGDGRRFLLFDYSNMEACVLAWLCKDPLLERIVDQGGDVYEGVFGAVMGGSCRTPRQRDFVKSTFLPVVYGLQPRQLAAAAGLTDGQASALVEKYHRAFPGVFRWVGDAQEAVRAEPKYADALGRVRDYSRRPWTVRNGIVQGPAAAVCLEKLVDLCDGAGSRYSVAGSIHDGYLLVTDVGDVPAVAEAARAVLEADSRFCPGVGLRVSCEVGATLGEMERYEAN